MAGSFEHKIYFYSPSMQGFSTLFWLSVWTSGS